MIRLCDMFLFSVASFWTQDYSLKYIDVLKTHLDNIKNVCMWISFSLKAYSVLLVG